MSVVMEDSYTIQISSKLVNRLASDEEKLKKKTKKLKPKVPHEPHQSSQSKAKASNGTQKSSSGGGWLPPSAPPMFLPLPPSPPPPPTATAELEAIRSVLRESESVVEKLEKHEADMIRELNQRAKELHDKEFKLPYQNPAPCSGEREACLECYREHLKDPLKCAQLVKNFAECARQARRQAASATLEK